MRVVSEIPHPKCKITIFSWNNKYLVKLEQNNLEQTFKISEMDIAQEADLMEILSEGFLDAAIKRFDEMHASLMRELSKL